MSKVSKTARASAGMVVREVKVIPDEVYIKNLRIDLESGLYVAQEGARALLRAYDSLLKDANDISRNMSEEISKIARNNQALDAELKAALSQIETLTQELEAANTAALANADALVTVIKDVIEDEKKEGDFIG